MKNYIKFCAYNLNSACVEVKFSDGAILFIDCTAVENKYAENIRQKSELDYLIYKKPSEYVKLLSNGEIGKYLNI